MPISGIAAVSADLKSQFLEGLAPRDLKTILSAATPRRFSANSIVTIHGQSAEHLYLLTKGRARQFFITSEGQKLLLQWLAPGDVFGGRSLLSSPSTYLVSTEMLHDSSVLVWDRATIRGLATRYPRLLENALSKASDYLTWQLSSHIGLACYTARQRLAQVLIALANTIGEKVSGGVELRVTNEELANAANVTPFTASRLLSEWQRNRAVIKHRGKVLLRSPERLFMQLA